MTMDRKASLPLGYRALLALQYAPRFKGKWRVANWIARHCQDCSNCLIRGSGGLRLSFPSLKDPIAFEWLINGRYEGDTLDFIISLLKIGDTVLDVGANVGTVAIPIAKSIGVSGNVVCVEASPTIFQYLQSNITNNNITNIRAICTLVGETDGEQVKFYDAPTTSFGMGGRSRYPGYQESIVISKRVDTILEETALSPPRIMKIDVEGYELNVLRSAERALRSEQSPIVIFEFNDWSEKNAGFPVGAAQDYLVGLGFRLHTLENAIARKQALVEPLRSGSAMLVASREDLFSGS
jgi:FkbM family methyltransferase